MASIKTENQIGFSIGVYYKYNDTDVIDSCLQGAFTRIGIKDNDGFDVTLYASKIVSSLLRPLLHASMLTYNYWDGVSNIRSRGFSIKQTI